ncbi:MAG TPA: AI-2E family transporter [Actinomycetota bacterium]|nr:AI-2E family transporter [Actinomycetota bacterium]
MAVTNRRQAPEPRDSFRRAGIVSWALIGCLLLAWIFLYVLYFLRDVFPPIALALILIFLLNPMVNRLERRGVRRGIGTALIYLAFLALVVVGMSILVPPLGRQINGLVERGPEIQQNAIEAVERTAERLNISLDAIGFGDLSGDEPTESGQSESPRSETPSFIEEFGSRLFAGAAGFATGALHAIVNFVLAPVFAAYLLIDLPKIQKAGKHYMPPRFRREWIPLVERIGNTVGSFFRGQLLVAAIVGLMSCLVFLIIGLPFWLPIGLLAGFFNIIPLIGPFVGGGVAVIVGGIEGGPSLAIKAALAMLVVQQIDNHFISPKVMGWAVRLHPVAVMIALLLGASLGGIWGMLLAVPMMGVAKILFVHFYETRILGNWSYYEEPTAGEGLVKEPGEESDLPSEAPAALPEATSVQVPDGDVAPKAKAKAKAAAKPPA